MAAISALEDPDALVACLFRKQKGEVDSEHADDQIEQRQDLLDNIDFNVRIGDQFDTV